jgi:hypothetical protein
MENHPIPQNITGFQFKLIGALTVRQFAYVAGGLFFAWLTYFIFKLPLFISLPLSLFFSLGGLALAFLPVDGRPLDAMLMNFIKAVFAPTKYMYEKQGGSAFSPTQTPIGISGQPQSNTLTPTPTAQEPIVRPLTHPKIVAPPINQPDLIPPIPTPSSQPVAEQEVQAEIKKDENNEKALNNQIAQTQQASQPTQDLEQRLSEIMAQKEALEKQLKEFQNKMAQPAPTFPTTQPIQPPPPAYAPPPPPPAQSVASQPSQPPMPQPIPQPIQTGFEAEPNLISGSVKDSRGNALQNILVEIKDEEDIPVRAFKTTANGQFSSATPVANGSYVLSLEDPKMIHKFDETKIEAVGSPIAPLQIISIDPREELRRELFN